MEKVFRFISLILLISAFEVGGGWLVWRALRSNRPLWWGVVGVLIFFFYGVASTARSAHFGRMYAAYGGFFVVLSLIWGLGLDGNFPDRFDVIGAAVSMAGLGIMFFGPRG